MGRSEHRLPAQHRVPVPSTGVLRHCPPHPRPLFTHDPLILSPAGAPFCTQQCPALHKLPSCAFRFRASVWRARLAPIYRLPFSGTVAHGLPMCGWIWAVLLAIVRPHCPSFLPHPPFDWLQGSNRLVPSNVVLCCVFSGGLHLPLAPRALWGWRRPSSATSSPSSCKCE